MSLQQLREQYIKDQKEERKKYAEWSLVAILLGSQMFNHIFWVHLIWLTTVYGCLVYLGFMGIFKKEYGFKESFYRSKVVLWKLFSLGGGFGGIALCIWLGGFNSYLDIPSFIQKDYERIEGKADILTTHTRGYSSQSITINGVSLSNKGSINEGKYDGKGLVVDYLPRSKYVINIWEQTHPYAVVKVNVIQARNQAEEILRNHEKVKAVTGDIQNMKKTFQNTLGNRKSYRKVMIAYEVIGEDANANVTLAVYRTNDEEDWKLSRMHIKKW